ncbi:MAG: regulator protein [Promethearchaeota archaeon CR_4]|nr:MAG: regulator protein [Candidatus Lokiarchaeota archaeon CR_4]
MSKIDEAKKLLEDLQGRVPDISDLAIARTNGLIIYTLQKVASDAKSERMLGGMASALFSISKRAADELLKGNFKSLSVEIDKGTIFLIFTGKVILIALTRPEPNLGLLSLELEDAAGKLNTIFV